MPALSDIREAGYARREVDYYFMTVGAEVMGTGGGGLGCWGDRRD